MTELHNFVQEGMTGTAFIDAVSGIVNRGCHNPVSVELLLSTVECCCFKYSFQDVFISSLFLTVHVLLSAALWYWRIRWRHRACSEL